MPASEGMVYVYHRSSLITNDAMLHFPTSAATQRVRAASERATFSLRPFEKSAVGQNFSADLVEDEWLCKHASSVQRCEHQVMSSLPSSLSPPTHWMQRVCALLGALVAADGGDQIGREHMRGLTRALSEHSSSPEVVEARSSVGRPLPNANVEAAKPASTTSVSAVTPSHSPSKAAPLGTL